MKKNYFLIAISFAILSLSQPALSQHRCGQTQAEELLKADPSMREQISKATKIQENWFKNYKDNSLDSRASADYIIPVVFHVFHNYGPENISDAQVKDAIRVLNNDYQLKNSDTSSVASAFKSILGNAKIEFRLAQLDPQGNCTNGIVRIASLETYKGANYFGNASTSSLSRWPRDKYLNIWVVEKIESGGGGGGYVAGYTYRPANTAESLDGIMGLNRHTGTIGTSSVASSRTLTHEVGHWLSLAHTWGNTNDPGVSTNCSDDDGISDTPNTVGWFGGCNLGAVSCGTLDNVQNYMDYASCSIMFTQGQATNLRAALTSSVAQRSSLWQTSNLTATGVLDVAKICKAEFSTNRTEVCTGQAVNFTDASYNEPTQWNWTFSGGSPSASNQQNPSVTYLTTGVYNVQLTVNNTGSSKNITKNNLINVLNLNGKQGPINESFENYVASNNEWFINNPDNAATWGVTNVGATGGKSMKINNFNNPAEREDELISNTIDISKYGSLHVSFKVAYAQKSASNNDLLSLFVSSNCGETWVMRWSKSGGDLASTSMKTTAFTPAQTEWKQYTITNIPASFFQSNFRIKFNFKSGNGNNIYIDDINIVDPSLLAVEEYNSNMSNLNIYPNPLLNNANVDFSLSQPDNVQMSLIDMLGKEYILLAGNKTLASGNHSFNIDKSKMGLSEGVYFLRLISEGKPVVKKIVIH